MFVGSCSIASEMRLHRIAASVTLFVLVCCVVGAAAVAADVTLQYNGTYWHNWSDEDGVTHLTQCHFKNYSKVNLLPPSMPMFLNVFGEAANVQLANTPPGWQGPWHRDPVPQFVFFMHGRGLWKLMDGTEHIFNPGDVYFGNDQNSTKGHESYTFGNESMLLAMIQFPNLSRNMYKPCWFE